MIEILIKNISVSLSKKSIPYMIIGGQAVLLYGTPRMTRDIDITLGVDIDRLNQIREICKKLRLKIIPPNPEDFVKKTRVLPAESNKFMLRVDFIFSYTPYERQAIKRARNIKVENSQVRFASPEDLIIHKIFAGRAIDREDVKNILIKNIKKIDIKYIRKWLKQFSQIPEQKDLLVSFNKILKKIKF